MNLEHGPDEEVLPKKCLGLGFEFGYKYLWVLGLGIGLGLYQPNTQNPIFFGYKRLT